MTLPRFAGLIANDGEVLISPVSMRLDMRQKVCTSRYLYMNDSIPRPGAG